MKIAAFLASLCIFSGSSLGAADMPQHNITIYSKASPGAIDPYFIEQQASNPNGRVNIPGYAIVRSIAPMSLERGVSNLQFTDVAAGIDPTTVSFKSLTHPETTKVFEQNYKYDLVGTGRILERYLGKEITIQQIMGESFNVIKGRLMASNGDDIILQLSSGEMLSVSFDSRNIVFPELPEGLITRPTLDWLVNAERSGEHEIQVSYETKGMTWWSDYNIIYHEKDETLDLNSWVTIVNQSGGSFEDAKLKLIAGDVNRAPQRQVPQQARLRSTLAESDSVAPAGFTEKSLFEYHLYTLGRPASLPDRSIKQLELFPAAYSVPVTKKLIFDLGFSSWGYSRRPNSGSGNPYATEGDVKVFLEFNNDKNSGLGVPMPAGRIRVSQKDPEDGNLEFIGEDNLDHTPRNEQISIKLGNAFDVVGERKQLNYRWDQKQQWIEETIEVKLRNQKEESVEVVVRESLFRWSNWKIINNTDEYQKQNASSIEFVVGIKPEQEKVIRYTARYSW